MRGWHAASQTYANLQPLQSDGLTCKPLLLNWDGPNAITTEGAATALVTEWAALRAGPACATDVSGLTGRATEPRSALIIIGAPSGRSFVACVAARLARTIGFLACRAFPTVFGIAPACTKTGILIQAATVLADTSTLAARLGPSLQRRVTSHPASTVFNGLLERLMRLAVRMVYVQETNHWHEGKAVNTTAQSGVTAPPPSPNDIVI